MLKGFFIKEETGGLSDYELVKRAKAGSQECWKELIGRHHRILTSTVFKITGGREFDDVMQEVLIQLYKSLGAFRNDSSFSTFLYRLAINTACTEVKKMTSVSSSVAIGNDTVERMIEEENDSSDFSEEFEKSEREELTRAALSRIPAESRMYLTLFYVEELTLKEISEIVKTPVTTVASRINKAKVLLMKEVRSLQ